MESVRPSRRGVVQGLLGAALAGFGVRRATADQSGGATPVTVRNSIRPTNKGGYATPTPRGSLG